MAKKNAERPLSHAEIADAQFHTLAARNAASHDIANQQFHGIAAMRGGLNTAALHVAANAIRPGHLNPQQKKAPRRS